jgi:hypothetical protein
MLEVIDQSGAMPRVTTLWNMMREIIDNSLYKDQQIHRFLTEQELATRQIARVQSPPISFVMNALKVKLAAFYQPIHVYRPLLIHQSTFNTE